MFYSCCCTLAKRSVRSSNRGTGNLPKALCWLFAMLGQCLLLWLCSSSLRYAISVDLLATTFMCVVMGLLSCVPAMSHLRSHVVVAFLLLVTDIFEYNIRTAVAISSVTASIGGYASKFTMTAMKTISFKKVYQGVVVVYLNLFIICAITLAIDAAITATAMITWTSTITSAMSWCNESPILGSLFGIYIYGSLSPGTCGHTYLETIC